jgi:hypothetical protein
VSLLKKLFGGKSEPVARTRVCVDWCSILRGQKEMEDRSRVQHAD